MCDYSLEMYASRPAREDEKYVTTRFSSGSIGFVAPGDPTCAICMQYDTPLTLENLPEHVRAMYGVSAREEVVFARIETGAYKDAVRFADGRVVSLQQLGPDVSATIRQLLEHRETPARIAEPAF